MCIIITDHTIVKGVYIGNGTLFCIVIPKLIAKFYRFETDTFSFNKCIAIRQPDGLPVARVIASCLKVGTRNSSYPVQMKC